MPQKETSGTGKGAANRFVWSWLLTVVIYWAAAQWLWFGNHPAGRWHSGLLMTFTVYEFLFVLLWEYMRTHNPEQNVWVILGSKVVKLLMAIVLIVAVRFAAPQVPLMTFSIDLLGIYFTSLVFEIIFFAKLNK